MRSMVEGSAAVAMTLMARKAAAPPPRCARSPSPFRGGIQSKHSWARNARASALIAAAWP